MVTVAELTRAVDNAFATTAQGLEPWPDPHPDRAPLDDEYSRVLDPRKWRITPAGAEAWCTAAVDLGLATLERDVAVRWATDRGRGHARVDRLVPRCVDGLPLVLAYSAFEGVDVNAVTIGVGDPAVEVTGVPTCGCDACDSGSRAVPAPAQPFRGFLHPRLDRPEMQLVERRCGRHQERLVQPHQELLDARGGVDAGSAVAAVAA